MSDHISLYYIKVTQCYYSNVIFFNCRKLIAIPLTYVGALTESNSLYEDIENFQPKYPPVSTSEFGCIKTANCPAYMPTTYQNKTPAVADTYDMPTMQQNQPASNADTYEMPTKHQNQPASDADTYDMPAMHQNQPACDADTYDMPAMHQNQPACDADTYDMPTMQQNEHPTDADTYEQV